MNTEIIKIRGCLNVPANEIVLLQGDNNYSIIHLSNGKKVLIAITLKELEVKFGAFNFYRIHKTYMVNTGWIERFCVHKNLIYLANNQHIEVARRRLSEFKKYWFSL